MAGEQQSNLNVGKTFGRRKFLRLAAHAAVAAGGGGALFVAGRGVGNQIHASNAERMTALAEQARPYADDTVARVVQGVRDGTLKLEPSYGDYDGDGILESQAHWGSYYVSAQEPGNALGPRIVVSFEEGTQLLPRVQYVEGRDIIVEPTPHIENATRVRVTVPSEDPKAVEYTYNFYRFRGDLPWSVDVNVYEGGDVPPYSVAGTNNMTSSPKDVKQWLDGETGKAQSFKSAVNLALGA